MLFFCHMKQKKLQFLMSACSVFCFKFCLFPLQGVKPLRLFPIWLNFFLFGVFFFLFCSIFKLCISTFDSWKLFVIVFGICKCSYFDLHEYEGLKVQLFNLFLC